MSFRNAFLYFRAVSCGVLLSGAALRAQDTQPASVEAAPQQDVQTAQGAPDAPATIAAPFTVSIQNGEAIGSEQVVRVTLTAGTNEFAFVVPRGLNLRVDASTPGKITISKKDCSYFVTLRLLQGMGEAASASLFQNLVLSQYEGASGLEESSMSADGQSGPSFDASWYVAGTSTRRTVRVAFIPTRAGTLECSLIADPKKSSEAKSALSAVLLTLRSNKAGKLENLALMDES